MSISPSRADHRRELIDLGSSRTNSVFAVHALSPNHQLLHYEQSQLFPKMKTFKLPREALSNPEHEVTTRSDLESVGLVICSNEVSPLHFLRPRDPESLNIRMFACCIGRTSLHREFRLPDVLPRFRKRSPHFGSTGQDYMLYNRRREERACEQWRMGWSGGKYKKL